ncbi:MAG TPA: HPF/RaiA family ribosome-associated protein [Candidatus Paceibacterota bacterium]|nr:HPF/RaiA family ribosome-associated protein [Candidatus Paceibacterota bacterium]
MNIRVKTNEYQLTPEASEYLDDKLAQIEKNTGVDSLQARVEVELGRAAGHHKHSDHMYFAELQLVRPGMARLIARNHEPTINAAIDNAKDELLVQLRREKRLHSRLWRRSGAFAKRLLRLE